MRIFVEDELVKRARAAGEQMLREGKASTRFAGLEPTEPRASFVVTDSLADLFPFGQFQIGNKTLYFGVRTGE